MSTQVSSEKYLHTSLVHPGVGGRSDGIGLERASNGLVAVRNGDLAMTLDRSIYCEVFEDFLGVTKLPTTGDTIVSASSPFYIKDTSSAGSPTKVIVGDADNGQLALAFDSQSEAQVLTLSFNDEQNIDSDQEPVVIFRLSVDAAFTTSTTKCVFGFASAQNDTEDSVAQNAWFLLTGTGLAVYLESDNATTDTDDKVAYANGTTALVLEAATMYEFKASCAAVDGASITDVRFFYRATLGGDWIPLTAPGYTFKMLADQAIQPYLQLRKAANTDTSGIKIDYVRCYWKRN